jgi:multidrug efflux pump subunit AcrB
MKTIEIWQKQTIRDLTSVLENIRSVSSRTRNGFAAITIEINKSASLDFMKFLVNDAISILDLPENIYPQVSSFIPDAEENRPILTYRFYGKLSTNDLNRDIQKRFYPLIQNIRGISDIRLSGASNLELSIKLDEDRINQLSINRENILNVINENYKSIILGKEDYQSNTIYFKLNKDELNLNDFKSLPIKVDKQLIRLDQLAQISIKDAPIQSLSRYNGYPSLTMEIYRKDLVNVLNLIEEIKSIINKIETPENQNIELVDDQSIFMKNEFRSLLKRLLWSALAVLIVLFVFSRNFREPILLFLSIVISISMTFIYFYLFNLSINFLSLAGIALSIGMLVDNAIIIFEQLRINDDRTVKEKLKHLFFPIMASTLTTFIVLIPFLFLTENLRELYIPFIKAMIFSLSSSFIVSFFILPIAFERYIRKKNDAPIKSRIKNFAEPYIKTTVNYPKTIIFFFVWIIGFPSYLIDNESWEKLGLSEHKEFINYAVGGSTNLFYFYVYKGEEWTWGEETYLNIRIHIPFGSSIKESNKIVEQFEKNLLKAETGIRIISQVYHEFAMLTVYFDTANLSKPYYIKSKAIILASELGGVSVSVSGFGPGYSNGGSGSYSTFAFKIKGYNYKQLKNLAKNTSEKLSKNKRIANVEIKSRRWSSFDRKELHMEFNRSKIIEYGLTVREISDQCRLRINELYPSTRILFNGNNLPIRLSFSEEESDISELLNSTINKENAKIPLKEFISFNLQKIPDEIIRENQEYILKITFDYKGPFQFGEKYVKEFLADQYLPLGYSLSRDQFQFSTEDEDSSIYGMFLAIILIFLLSSALFESFKLGFLILLAIPASLTGIFFIYFISEQSFTLAARIGVILICGLTVNNAIILTSEILRLNKRMHLKKAVIEGTLSRLRPILMTTLTTILGMIPLLFTEKISGEDLFQTLSLTIIGGLSSSMILILIVFPAFNYLFIKKRTDETPINNHSFNT